MSTMSLWLVLAGVLLIAEITTGTFYLLMVSLGAGVGALLAHLGFGLELQIGAAALFAVLGSLALQKSRKGRSSAAHAKHDVLDIGNSVEIKQWDSNGRTQVLYRGANWAAESVDSAPTPGLHEIVAVQGNTLRLKRS
ncbi:NfeD family protein [Limnobacter sp.]|uniref:NfeD family protein n=1 Tax=Limnobacter sp. TaxID=2003368 RepID=UPI003511CD93